MRIALLSFLLAGIAATLPARAGTTGALTGAIVDSDTGKPLAGAVVYAASPAQVCKTTTDAAGHYVCINLIPGTYTVSVLLKKYEPYAVAGVPISADSEQTLILRPEHERLSVTVDHFLRALPLVRPGVSADVYNVNRSALPWYGLLTSGFADDMRFTPGVLVGPGVRMMP